jgi:hypothetical protein
MSTEIETHIIERKILTLSLSANDCIDLRMGDKKTICIWADLPQVMALSCGTAIRLDQDNDCLCLKIHHQGMAQITQTTVSKGKNSIVIESDLLEWLLINGQLIKLG